MPLYPCVGVTAGHLVQPVCQGRRGRPPPRPGEQMEAGVLPHTPKKSPVPPTETGLVEPIIDSLRGPPTAVHDRALKRIPGHQPGYGSTMRFLTDMGARIGREITPSSG